MPDTRSHRGPDPEDARLFDPAQWSVLRLATSDLCWLWDRGYAAASSIELVGNRYELRRRQRIAVGRCACSRVAQKRRRLHHVEPEQLQDRELWLDGYNVLTGIEAALAGGVILLGCDGCCRDVAGVHAGYRRVAETEPALRLVGEWASQQGVRACHWWLDKPISNSGRLKTLMLEIAAAGGWRWDVDLVFNPDHVLIHTQEIIASSDSVILDHCERWVNLVRLVLQSRIPQARLIDLSVNPRAS